jgi:DNA-binding transcriptional ArsR family regulator
MWRNGEMDRVLTIFKALGDESRLRALLALQKEDLCVCQITELLDLAPSTVSKHMSILKAAGLVTSRKQGRWTYYRWAGADASPLAQDALQQARLSLREDGLVKSDVQRLDEILQMTPEELCCRK